MFSNIWNNQFFNVIILIFFLKVIIAVKQVRIISDINHLVYEIFYPINEMKN